MGALLPVAVLVAAYVGAAAAVISAISAATLVAIIAAVVAVASTAAATYFYIQGDIKNSMLFSGIALAAGVGGIYVTYLSYSANIAALMSEGTASALASAEALESSAVMQMASYVTAVYNAWTAFADFIHLKLLWQIHQIAYLVSTDYREMMNRVFQQIAYVSNMYGFGALSLNLLFENTRRGVLDISSAMGKSYDLGQIEWLGTYNELLKEFARNAEHYKNRPADFLQWIADNTDRPGYDAKSATMRTIMGGVESALSLVKSTAEIATKVRNDLMKLIADLPEVIRKQWEPEVKKVVKQFDDFMRLNYDPMMKQISAAFDTVGKMIEEDREKAKALNERLSRPGKYLSEIDDLPEDERIEDEETIAAIAARGMSRQVDDFSVVLAEVEKFPEVPLYEEEVKRRLPIREYTIPKPPKAPEISKIKMIKPPFVGEY
jgi:hypothetical protein